jgi:hypothetical protein
VGKRREGMGRKCDTVEPLDGLSLGWAVKGFSVMMVTV